MLYLPVSSVTVLLVLPVEMLRAVTVMPGSTASEGSCMTPEIVAVAVCARTVSGITRNIRTNIGIFAVFMRLSWRQPGAVVKNAPQSVDKSVGAPMDGLSALPWTARWCQGTLPCPLAPNPSIRGVGAPMDGLSALPWTARWCQGTLPCPNPSITGVGAPMDGLSALPWTARWCQGTLPCLAGPRP